MVSGSAIVREGVLDQARHNESLLSRLKSLPSIPALDAIRGVSALMVVVAHTVGPRQLGSMAVAVFFVLSGFLITWLLVGESEKTQRISLSHFYLRRTLRIFPAFYAFWVLCVGAALLRHAHIDWHEVGSSFFYVGDYYYALRHSSGGIMGITWSLGVEEKFYLLWPFLFASLHRDPSKLCRISLTIILAICVYRVFMTLLVPLPPDYLRYAFESRFDNILFGCVAALSLRLGKVEAILRAAAAFPILPLGIAGSLVALCFVEEAWGSTYHYTIGMPLDATLITIMMLQLVFLGAKGGWTWLNHPVLRFFGKISYSLYLYHFLVVSSVDHYLPGLRVRFSYPLIFMISILGAYLSFRLIETPFLRLKSRL